MNPGNVTAGLVVGTADARTFLAVDALVAIGVAALAGSRVAVGRYAPT